MNHKLTKEERKNLVDKINKIIDSTNMTDKDFMIIITILIAARFPDPKQYAFFTQEISIGGVRSLLKYEEEHGAMQ
ncbi:MULTISPECIES: hypothetical protein [unclassified Roseobacter]|uniref:hypothetical protein n=1 Tax=unclassified Roseobacter TaxID=196798 RepID=UPI0014910DA8|nr:MULTISPECIES: hypothetical protein [unclassified Roseobacter]NNW55479.1 hypothetical protein [Roseobacter sp. HKCCD8284]NNY17334.1 hypothetical protein [Roseobacter sp. HKCCD8191]